MLSSSSRSPQSWRKKKIFSFLFRFLSPQRSHKEKLLRYGKGSLIRRFFVYLPFLLFVLFCVGTISGIIVIAYVSRDLPSPDQLITRNVVESSKIYDRTGEHLLYEIHGDKRRTAIKLDELPKYVVNSTIAMEDRTFYTHSGLNFLRTAKAVVLYFLDKIYLYHGSVPGGSTLTQQLVKNAILSPEKTVFRKMREWILSWQIERKYSKEQILEMYFNEIPYGSVVYGIEAAAETFFGKSAKDLTLGEAALLTAIIKAPTYYSPYGSHVDELLSRQKTVLRLMKEQKYISQEELETAENESLQFSLKREGITAPHFVMYVKELLEQKYQDSFLQEGGLKIITTLDFDKQKDAEEIITKNKERINKYGATNAALATIDATTGQILTMVGSVDFFNVENQGQVNVTIRPRQPGSSFKPIVYTAAFEKGYWPETILYDVETVFKDVCSGSPDYTPHNYTGKDYGAVSMRKALDGSLNISAVKTLYLAGVDNVLDFAINRLGYESLKNNRNNLCLSVVLGGGEVTLLEHVGAFSVFAQEGKKHNVSAILEIKDKNGSVLEKFKDKTEKVLEPKYAQMINSVLSDNEARSYIFGSNSSLTLPDRPVAAKTGTTNDYRDSWVIGYTPSIVSAVWVGNNDNKALKEGSSSSMVAAPIWQEYMIKILKDTPVENFTPPPANTSEKPVLRGQEAEEVKLKINKETNKIATEFTPPELVEEKTYKPIHSILHYLLKDNPEGAVPSDPATADQQYAYWEEGIKKWAEKNKILIEEPPTEMDNLYTAENQPELIVNSPQNNETIKSRTLTTDISVSAKGGNKIDRVEYYLDADILKVVNEEPFNLDYYINHDNLNGFHLLRIVAHDSAKNFKTVELNLNFLLEYQTPSYSFLNISGEITLKKNRFPRNFVVKFYYPENISAVEFFWQNPNTMQREIIASEKTIDKSNYKLTWTDPPAVGKYEVLGAITDRKMNTIIGEKMEVIIE